MHTVPKKGLAAAAIAGIAIVPFVSQPASAAPAPRLKVVKTLTTSVIGPLQFAVDGNRVLVADSFASTLTRIGRSKPLATGGGIDGVGINSHSGAYAFTSTSDDHTKTTLTIRRKGHKDVVANLSRFEKNKNPDGKVHYGVDHPANQCVIDAFTFPPGPEGPAIPATYKGQVDSHPYAVASLGKGNWAVADAGGNDIVRVNKHGHVSLIKVLPRQPLVVTAAIAAQNKLPDCAIGVTYNSEPVPTDVEVRGNRLYVSTLSGGISPGSVYRMTRHGNHVRRLATGLVGATNVAVGKRGSVYVAELFTGTISRVANGTTVPLLTLPGVAAIEFDHGHLYASTAPAAASEGGGSGPPPPGSVVKLGWK